MKKTVVFLCLSTLVICILYCVNKVVTYEKLTMLIQSNNIYLQSELSNYVNMTDLDSSKKQLVQKANDVSNYILNNIQTKKQIKSFSFLNLLNMINEDVWVEDMDNMKTSSVREKKLCMLEMYSIVIERYLKRIKTPFLSFSTVSVVPVSKQDTLKMGEEYSANIYLNVCDITNMISIEFEDSTIFQGKDLYHEKASQKGFNAKKGNLVYNNGFMQYLFPIEIKYYVK